MIAGPSESQADILHRPEQAAAMQGVQPGEVKAVGGLRTYWIMQDQPL